MRSLYRCRETHPAHAPLWRRRRSGGAFEISADPQPRVSSPPPRCRLSAVPCLRRATRRLDEVRRTLPVAGFSVTIPHKQRILRYLDIVDPLARRIGAVNTVWRKAGKWRGTNTDTEGVLKPLEPPSASGPRLRFDRRLRRRRARGSVRALRCWRRDHHHRPQHDECASSRPRRQGQAVTLEEARKNTIRRAGPRHAPRHAPQSERVSLRRPHPGRHRLRHGLQPARNAAAQAAEAQGCTVIPGLEMLLEQAAHQFEIWTGETAPRAVMRSALKRLERHDA